MEAQELVNPSSMVPLRTILTIRRFLATELPPPPAPPALASATEPFANSLSVTAMATATVAALSTMDQISPHHQIYNFHPEVFFSHRITFHPHPHPRRRRRLQHCRKQRCRLCHCQR